MSATKVCRDCKKRLPLSQFYKNGGYKDGLAIRCKRCHNMLRKAPKGTGRGPGRPPSPDGDSGTSFLFKRMKPVERTLQQHEDWVNEMAART